MKATLTLQQHDKNTQYALSLPCLLGEPLHDESASNLSSGGGYYFAWLYHGRVAVRSYQTAKKARPRAIVHNAVGSGAGQAEFFDKLVGERIAELRMQVGRKLRDKRKADPFAEQVSLKFDIAEAELYRIRELIQGHADDRETQDFDSFPAKEWPQMEKMAPMAALTLAGV